MNIRAEDGESHPPSRWLEWGECALIFTMFFLIAGWLPPDVNEAHYLCKARHYWDPEWCRLDLFLQSADAHTVFYWSFGWLTRLLPLPTVAWLGRILTWALMAWSFRRLSWALNPRPMMSALAAGLFLALQFWGHMAGEWVVGGLEAKGFAYVLVFLGWESLVRSRWSRMWILFGAAAAFHVLVGGWSVVAGMIAFGLAGQHRPPILAMLPGLLVGGLLSLPGLVPCLLLNHGLDAETIGEANRIYVYERLAHHLVFRQFAWQRITAHLALLLIWAGLAWRQRLSVERQRFQLFTAAALLLAMAGALIDLTLPRSAWSAGLLRFYWFRLSDMALPLAVAVSLTAEIGRGLRAQNKVATLAVAGTSVLLAAFFGHHSWQQLRDLRPASAKQSRPGIAAAAQRQRAVYEDWIRLGDWIRSNTEPDAIFITPRLQQSFHWFSDRSEVASWKNIPQDAASLFDWWERIRVLYPPEVARHGLRMHGHGRIIELGDQYNARYIVLDRTQSGRPLALPRLYPTAREPNSSFEVYLIPAK